MTASNSPVPTADQEQVLVSYDIIKTRKILYMQLITRMAFKKNDIYKSLKPPAGLLASSRLSRLLMEAKTLLLDGAVMVHHAPQQADKLLVQVAHPQGFLHKH